MTSLPSTRPVRLAQQICRIAGVAYLMMGCAIVGILGLAPSLGLRLTGGETLFAVKDGVWTSSTLWWDGIINPVFHGMVFFTLAGALGYLADLGEALMEREADARNATASAESPPRVINIGDEIPSLTEDDLQPQR